MAGMIDQLTAILSEQAQRYEELLGLAHEKKDIIVQNDIEALQKITHLENMVISQNKRLEKQRLALAVDIADVLGRRGQDLDIGTLLSLIDGQPGQAELKAAGDRIREILAQLKEANDFNNSLIQNALDYIEYSLNMIRSSDQPVGLDYANEMRSNFDVRK